MYVINMRARLILYISLGCLPHLYGYIYYFGHVLLIKHTSMDKFRTFRDFLYFYKELAYIFALGYIILIAVIIALSILVIQKNDENRLLKRIIDSPSSYTTKTYSVNSLKSKCRMFSVKIDKR